MKNKRVFLTALMLFAFCLCGMQAFAAAEATEVYVTVSDGSGELALSYEKINVTDTDNDGAITITDALFCAHEANYEGGASAGYSAFESDYGLSLGKLWGVENGGSYGYYVNNASAFSLLDEVKNGDHVYAYVYTDTTAWSDAYSYFDVSEISAEVGESVTLTLFVTGYDANWNPTVSPCEGAVISINGQTTEAVTDAEGKAVLPAFENDGVYIVSASSDSAVLVPPVCVITCGSGSVVSSAEVSSADASSDMGASDVYLWIALGAVAVVALAAVAVVVLKKKAK